MPSLLIIDDSEAVLAKMKATLVAAGFNVVTTTQTVGAARYLRQSDLVLIDFYMPGIDGKAVLDSLRHAAEAVGASPLFYLCTSDAVLSRRWQELGFDGRLSAKGDDEALVAQVRSILKLQQIRNLRRS
jgi:two-component system, OmpR family, response regulator